MRDLLSVLTAVIALGSATTARSAGDGKRPLGIHARLSMLAMETGATTRAPAAELLIGGTWNVVGPWAAAASYRGGLRNAGSDALGIRTSHHRLQLGVQATVTGEVLFAGLEAGAHARWTSTHIHARAGPDSTHSDWGWGPAVDLFAGLHLTDRLDGTIEVGGYGRGSLVDLTLGLGASYRL